MISMTRKGTYTNYQARGAGFLVGDRVYPIQGSPANGGTVVAVWPAIGMVDVQYPHGATRSAVEDLVIDESGFIESQVDILSDTVPGGTHTVPVSGGPQRDIRASAQRVAVQFVKLALYWAARGRQYKPTQTELETGNLCCPRCEDAFLRRTVYKREGGKSTKLFVCAKCLFLVRREDVQGFEG